MLQRKTIFIIVFIVSLLIIGSTVYFLFFKKIAERSSVPTEERDLEEILKDLTAPSGEVPEISNEIRRSLTAPEKGEVSEDILQELTVPVK